MNATQQASAAAGSLVVKVIILVVIVVIIKAMYDRIKHPALSKRKGYIFWPIAVIGLVGFIGALFS